MLCSHIDCFYLGQTYTRIPKHLIRDNVNFLVPSTQDEMNLKHIYGDHVNTVSRPATLPPRVTNKLRNQ